MKKVIKGFVAVTLLISGLLIISFLFSGCGHFLSELDERLENSQSAVGGKMGVEILRCFSEKDSEGLKEMFCSRIKNTHDLDSEIEEAFAVIDKPIISHEPFSIGGEESVRDGDVTESYIYSTIHDVVVSEGKKYDVFFSAYLVKNKEDMIGVTRIKIYDDNHNLICIIGESI